MTLKTKPFDTADYLATPDMITGYINKAFATGDLATIERALVVVARALERAGLVGEASRPSKRSNG